MARIGFVGVGDISGIYLKNITGLFEELEIAGLCDLVREKAERAGAAYGGLKIYDDMHALFADPSVDIVLNITRPNEHYEVTKAALLAGKHVYCEKPLASTLEHGRALVALAREKGLTLCCAPDTFLGASHQGARKLIEEDVIGVPVAAAAHMISHGTETWHPDPAFYYAAPGGGPMLDMGPYYVTAMVQILGPVASVMGMTKITYPTRKITSKPLSGTVIDVTSPTHYSALLRFAGGAIATLVTTFDAYSMPGINHIELYGERGNMIIPDPNCFGGEIKIKIGEKDSPDVMDHWGRGDWVAIDSPYDVYKDNSRGLGLADMAKAISAGRSPRANAGQALHVLEVLTAIHRSSEEGREIAIEAPFEPQKLLPITAIEGVLD